MVPGGVLCFFGSLVSNRDKLADYRNITKGDGPRDSKNPRRSGICDKLHRMDANPNFAEMATDDSNLDRIRKTEEVGNFLEAARGRAPKRSSTTMATSEAAMAPVAGAHLKRGCGSHLPPEHGRWSL